MLLTSTSDDIDVTLYLLLVYYYTLANSILLRHVIFNSESQIECINME